MNADIFFFFDERRHLFFMNADIRGQLTFGLSYN